MWKAENLNFQSPAFLPFFTTLKVVCQCHRNHSLSGYEIWFKGGRAGRDGAVRLFGLVPSLVPSKEAKGFGWILAQASDLVLTKRTMQSKQPIQGSRKIPLLLAEAGRPGLLDQSSQLCHSSSPIFSSLLSGRKFLDQARTQQTSPAQDQCSGPVCFDVSIPHWPNVFH